MEVKWKKVEYYSMEETLVVDRIEGNIVVCENRSNGIMINIFVSNLPEGIREGTVLKYFDGKYRIDLDEQGSIEKRIEEKMMDLWE